nr:hypothetical protein [Allorhodopirellula solitaria]
MHKQNGWPSSRVRVCQIHPRDILSGQDSVFGIRGNQASDQPGVDSGQRQTGSQQRIFYSRDRPGPARFLPETLKSTCALRVLIDVRAILQKVPVRGQVQHAR